ncbi:class I SAM-dependent methyltransferase [Neolewinella antarctica]|uniref:16S rRNA G1207 methylase RsmC n=1 Tax=Neolewinella antarctica TaxID=442734 RepID=A0ABX0XC39_9BACT|nr:methyltransferase [Neolewinella antarctica]NJC26403.1 16S rRNA G1207 methylase RsmC [Neolewinella antarctica]
MRVSFEGTQFDFPAEALGGTNLASLLKPADELLLNWLQEKDTTRELVIYHDHYGVLGTVLAGRPGVTFVSDNIVHHDRLRTNYLKNGLSEAELPAPSATLAPVPHLVGTPRLAIMHLPKYLNLFEWYLSDLARHQHPDLELAVAFQTRHFTPKILEIAGRYANNLQQSRAYKKARTLVLSDWKKQGDVAPLLHEMTYREQNYRQFYGVFSANHIDYGTQFLLESWASSDQLRGLPEPAKILDIGVGNGVILSELRRDFYPDAQLIGTDASHVAIQSARMNAPADADLRWQSDFAGIPAGSVDLVVTNPPFHEGHRNAIAPTLALFKEAAKVLKFGGHFVVVANGHLNYATHLERIFGDVREVANNEKFVVYRSRSVL